MSVLREWRVEDGDWYVAQLDDPEIQAFTVESVETTVADFREALNDVAFSPDSFARAIVDDETGELAGNLAAGRTSQRAEVHYWLAAKASGRGLATAALIETCEWIAEHWPGTCRIWLSVRTGNTASVRVATRAGFQRDQLCDKHIEVHGELWCMEGYSRDARCAEPARPLPSATPLR